MKLLRENTEIRDKKFLMDADGTSENEPSELDIIKHLEYEGWLCDEIDIWYDNMMGFWRWNCKITKH